MGNACGLGFPIDLQQVGQVAPKHMVEIRLSVWGKSVKMKRLGWLQIVV